jgi:hypothetical protein
MARWRVGGSKTALHSSLAKMTGGMSLKTSLITPKLRTVYKSAVAGERVAH